MVSQVEPPLKHAGITGCERLKNRRDVTTFEALNPITRNWELATAKPRLPPAEDVVKHLGVTFEIVQDFVRRESGLDVFIQAR